MNLIKFFSLLFFLMVISSSTKSYTCNCTETFNSGQPGSTDDEVATSSTNYKEVKSADANLECPSTKVEEVYVDPSTGEECTSVTRKTCTLD